jgi:hypothetical protein
MDENCIKTYILQTFEGVQVAEDDGNLFFFYDAENRIPFATIVTTDKYDSYSDLDRPGVYRLNIGTGKDSYRRRFPVDRVPKEGGYDFTAIDIVMPHPEYGRVYWVCVLSPSDGTFQEIKPLLEEAYHVAVRKYTAVKVVFRQSHG